MTQLFALFLLGFMAFLPCGVVAVFFTTRKVLGIPPTQPYPQRCVVMRVVAGIYALFLGPLCALFALM